ncbi:MAG: hypothetical protein ACOYYI_17270 [Chloroflexota bacterium]
MNPPASSRSFWLTLLALLAIAHLTLLRAAYLRLLELGVNLTRAAWSGILLLFLAIALLCVWLIFRIAANRPNFVERAERITFGSPLWRILGGIIFPVILFLIPWLKFTYQIGQEVKQPVYDPTLLLLLYYWACLWLVLLAMTALKAAFRTTWLGGFTAALILLGLAYEIHYRYSYVSDYPFSLGWSEGSRYYYASLWFSKLVYGETFPLSTLHPTRYLLQSFPFLSPSLGIFAHRFWQFFLWIGLTAGASLALSGRVFGRGEKALRWLTAGWLFLFLLRVGVYYHLEVMVILPLWFVSAKKPWQTLLAVIVSSLWAGISRVNWFPMPAILAAAIYLLEVPFHSQTNGKTSLQSFARYLAPPALWVVVGIASALFAQWAYIPLSGNLQNAKAFTSSFTSDLLWYRLWPNATFPLGVIPAILVLSGPLLLIIFLAARQTSLHGIRWLGLTAMLIALFAGSTVVSAKIGGGGDLHNMDTYAVLVSLVALYFFSGRVEAEAGFVSRPMRPSPLIVIAVILPILTLIPMLSPYPRYNKDRNQQAHQQLVNIVNEIGRQGPVLFINERQMVALGEVNVPLVYDYEVVTLMEMAMSGNRAYLNRFYDDLQNQRFAAIISGRQNTVIKLDGVFAEENNVWNTLVSPYILCYYESNTTIEADDSRIEIYQPRTQTENCPSGE